MENMLFKPAMTLNWIEWLAIRELELNIKTKSGVMKEDIKRMKFNCKARRVTFPGCKTTAP